MKNLFLITILLLSTTLYADWDDEQKITPSDATEDMHFGNAVSIDGDYAVIGAIWDDENGYASGSAYIFHRNGTSWEQQAKLTASDGATEDRFGCSVSISGDYVVIGAHLADDILNDRGAAYIFHRSGTNWTQQDKLEASDGAEDDWFGWSVSIDGDYVVIGSVDDDNNNGNASGSAYIYHRNGTSWFPQGNLTASDGANFDNFGQSVSISGDYVVIGAHWDDDKGAAYIFHRYESNWTEKAKLTASDGNEEDWFGHSVSISGDYTVIGAYGDDDNDSRSGSAYVFHKNGADWTEQAKLIASDGDQFDNFGYTTSISGNYVAIGAGFNGNNGAAYIFHRSGTEWTEDTKLTASDGENEDWFGRSVSISGYYALIGAWQDDDNGAGSGSAYIYFNDGVFIEEENFNISVNAMIIETYPNPFTISTTIEYPLNSPQTVTITFYNSFGRVVDIIEEHQQQGLQKVVWTPENLPVGIYYFRLQAGEKVASGKLVLVK